MSDIVINTGSISGEITPKAAVTDGEVVRGRSLTGEVDRNVNANKDYERLINKPQINGVELVGDLSTEDLLIKTSDLDNDAGFIDKDVDDLTNYYDKTAIDGALQQVGEDIQSVADSIPTDLSQLNDDATHRTVTDADKAAWNAKSDFSGSYNDLTDKPDIPSALSDLTEDTTHRVVTDAEKTTWNGKSDFSGDYDDLSNKPEIPSELADLTEDTTHRVVTDTEKQTWNGKSNVAANPENATETLTSIDIDGTKYVIPQGGGGGDVQSVNGKTGAVTLNASDVGALPDDTPIPAAQIQSDWEQSDNTQKDYIKNKPTIPAAQVNSDWDAASGVAQILNKPTLGTAAALDVASSGDASTTQVVKGDDSRLTDARTPVSHTHTLSDITDAGTAASHDATNAVVQGSGDLVTSGAVWTAIDNLPEPLIFKGTLGASADSPTITSLPVAAATNEGYLYLVITAGTYASIVAKAGDRFACATLDEGTTYQWILLPAGDSGTDTWRNIKVNGTEKLGSAISTGGVDFVNGTNTTVSFDANGNKIKIDAVDTTYDPATQSADGLMSSTDKTKLDGIESGAQANAVTSVAGKTGAVSLEKSDVGLGNVPNVATDDQTPTVTEASTRTNIASGDTLKNIIGKIKKFFADLKAVAFSGSYSDLSNKPTKLSDFTNDLTSFVIKSGDTMTGDLNITNGGESDAPLHVIGKPNGAFIEFFNLDGETVFGRLGIKSDHLPYLGYQGNKRIALLEECATPSDVEGTQTATGSIVTVTDAADIYAEEVDVAVVATQTGSGTPSPSNIRPIQGYDIVSVDRCGKNLFDKDSSEIVASSYLFDDGSIGTPASNWIISGWCLIIGGFPLTLYNQGSATAPAICWYDLNKNFIGGQAYNGVSSAITVTPPKNAAYVRFSCHKDYVNTAQLEIGSQATTYTAFTGNDKVNIQLGNKNLLPMTVEGIKAANTSGTWSGNAYTYRGVTVKILTDNCNNIIGYDVDGTASGGNLEFRLIPNSPNTYLNKKINGSPASSGYEVGFLISMYDGATWKNEQFSYNQADSVLSIDRPNIVISIFVKNGSTASHKKFYPMVRDANDDPTFSPYNPTLGDMVYGGQLTLKDDGSAVFVGDRALVTLTGSESGASIIWNSYTFIVSDAVDSNSGVHVYGCSHSNDPISGFEMFNSSSSGHDYGYSTSVNKQIRFRNRSLTQDLSSYQTWLQNQKNAGTPVQICYELATPFTIHLSAEQLKLLQGTNNVWSNAGDVTLKYQPDNVIAEPKADVQRLRDDVDLRLEGNACKNISYLISLGAYDTSTGADPTYSSSNSDYASCKKVPCKKGESFSVSSGIDIKQVIDYYWDNAGTYLGYYVHNFTAGKYFSFESQHDGVMAVSIRAMAYKTSVNDFINFQLERGSSPSPYEEYYPSNRELGERGSVVSLATNKGSNSGDSFTLTNITNYAFLQFVLCKEFMPYYCFDEVILPSSKVSTIYGTNNKIFLRSKENTTTYAVVSFASATSATVNIYNAANNEKVFIFGIK